MWAALERERQALLVSHERPDNSFTTAEYAERFKIGKRHAARQVEKLRKAGKIERHGPTCSRLSYYTLVEDNGEKLPETLSERLYKQHAASGAKSSS